MLKTSKLPLSLLDSKPVAGREKIHILDTESYKETFSKVKIFLSRQNYPFLTDQIGTVCFQMLVLFF